MIETFVHRLNGLSPAQIAIGCTLVLLQGAVFTLFPEEVVMLGMGALCARGQIQFPYAVAAILLGLLPANATMFLLGRNFGIKLLRKRPFRWVLKKSVVARARLILRTHGTRIVFTTRFVPSVRAPLYFAAGMSSLRLWRFIRADLTASLIHTPLLLAGGMLLGRS